MLGIACVNSRKGPPIGYRGMRDKTFFVCGIRDWLKNCQGMRDSNIGGIRDWPENCSEYAKFHLIAREIEIEELTPQSRDTVNSLYVELARDLRICSR